MWAVYKLPFKATIVTAAAIIIIIIVDVTALFGP
jgi:hypothetical protein